MYYTSDKNIAKDFLKFRKMSFNRPDFKQLCEILREFAKFPYENLTKIIKSFENELVDDKMRYPGEVLNDHISFNAGGTCYSLTYFFKTILDYCEFESYAAFADRSYGENTHCALIVTIDGKRYLADPGYCLEYPIELPELGSSRCELPNNNIEIAANGHYARRVGRPVFNVVTDQGGKKQVRYRLKDSPASEDEFKHWWRESFNWPMMRSLCITKNTDEGYIFVRNNNIRHNTKKDRHQIKVDKDFEGVISKEFDIDKKIVVAASDYLREQKEKRLSKVVEGDRCIKILQK